MMKKMDKLIKTNLPKRPSVLIKIWKPKIIIISPTFIHPLKHRLFHFQTLFWLNFSLKYNPNTGAFRKYRTYLFVSIRSFQIGFFFFLLFFCIIGFQRNMDDKVDESRGMSLARSMEAINTILSLLFFLFFS